MPFTRRADALIEIGPSECGVVARHRRSWSTRKIVPTPTLLDDCCRHSTAAPYVECVEEDSLRLGAL